MIPLPNFQGQSDEGKPLVFVVALRYLTPLGEGCDRVVFDCGDGLVLKLGKYRDSNTSEASVWEAVQGTELEQYFAPVRGVCSEGTWLLMDKVEQAPVGDSFRRYGSVISMSREEYRHAITAMARLPRETGLTSCDLHSGNWGVLDGRPVVCDYASFYRSKA